MPICSVEKCIIEHCSPTLAGIKPAGLFSCCMAENDVLEQVKQLNMKLNKKDIVVSVMAKKDGRSLIYVYRPSRLRAELAKTETSEFLKTYGYGGLTVEKSVALLKRRIAKTDGFPMK